MKHPYSAFYEYHAPTSDHMDTFYSVISNQLPVHATGFQAIRNELRHTLRNETSQKAGQNLKITVLFFKRTTAYN